MSAVLAAIAACSACCAKDYDRYGLYGVGHPAGGYLLSSPQGYDDMVWRRIAEAGATSVRQAASWREIEAVKGTYDWTQIEDTLKYCRKYPQIRPYLLIVNTPGWARADGQPSHLPPMPSAIPDFRKFCRALAQRYKGYADHFEVWNEQNGFGWEVPPYNQFDKYLPLLEAAYEGLKEGNPECVVSLGGLDDADGHSPIFAKGCYDLRAKDYGSRAMWDAFGDHPYRETESMMAKLRAIKGIAAAYGDCNLEMWLTEYGFHTGEMSEEEQAKRLTDYMTTLITDPEFRYVTETNYLCVADFEETTHGFGLCDANLRPRPAFWAYQRLPRPGRIVISDIAVRNVSPTSVELTFATDADARCTVQLGNAAGKLDKSIGAEEKPTKQHSASITGLSPNTTYHYVISATAPGLPAAQTLDYDLTTLAETGVRNPGFEGGFVVEIAKQWDCLGDNLCWDSARLSSPFNLMHSGKHAQCIVANGGWGDGLDDAVAGQASAVSGVKYTLTAWTQAVDEGKKGSIERKIGIDPTGGRDPKSANVIWSEPSKTLGKWEKQSVSAVARASVITVFAHARSIDKDEGRDFFYVDDVELK